MDNNNDQEWQSYYAAMMMENSPASYFKRSASSPYDRDDDRIDDDGDRFYEGDDIGCDVGYNDDEERDEEEREEADEEEETPARGDGAPTSPCGDRRGGTKRRSSKKRKRRDPNKPKGCLTAVLMYSNANRERVKTENPDLKFGDVARLLSAEYSSLPPEDAAIWQKASVDDRVRYNREMLSYVPPAQVSGDGGDATADRSDDDSIVADDEAVAVVESRPAPKKPKKDPNAPKKPLSSWHFFTSGCARRQVLAQHPTATARDVMGLLSSQYKVLLEEERAVLDERANADRERYEMEMLEYEANGGYIAD
ncbi:hypothetical protein ACHAW5_003596 [Stephanodiscus triporus]|uniref:HMG box domain-containing protein n=1 Tax=Stephanodiscus triporus TaxID=2934178 RepID=A0ABD3PCF6_9STRA